MSEPPPFSPTVTLLTVGRVWEAAFAEGLKPLGLTTRKYGLPGHVRGVPGISSGLGPGAVTGPRTAMPPHRPDGPAHG
ncbi:hypothetical protein ACFXAE_13055 [Streptomyces sp. NPDC059454]|uniref:hypothetical protein n=1 Tax=Streptomyces sp. NPDC059454 TaxID=3346836 RepID=UPI0036923842